MNNDFSPRIGFIGAGRVGTTLGKYFVHRGQTVVGYTSRSQVSAKQAAQFTDTTCYENIEDFINNCNMIFLTVPDSQIEDVWHKVSKYNITGKIISHCSGAMSSKIFSDITMHGAFGYSIHPLCAVSSKEESYKTFDKVFFTVEGAADKLNNIIDWLKSMGNPVTSIDGDNKVLYHASAVFASNLVIGLFGTACSLLEECGFNKADAEMALSGLFAGNCSNIVTQGMANALTGPVDRNDINTIEKHLAVLDGDKREIYTLLSKKLIDIAKNKNLGTDYSELIKLLRD